MKTQDHEAITRYLIDHMEYPVDNHCQKAMLLGSVLPDYNPFTYLRGSFREQPFRGHNYDNVQNYMKHLIQKMDQVHKNKKKKCYYMGKLLHYVVDSFTYPHNREFTGSIAEHRIYENTLHEHMWDYMGQNIERNKTINPERKLFSTIIELHNQYINEMPGYLVDYKYITRAVMAVYQYAFENEEVFLYLQSNIA